MGSDEDSKVIVKKSAHPDNWVVNGQNSNTPLTLIPRTGALVKRGTPFYQCLFYAP